MSDATCEHTKAPDGARFCPECGSPLAKASRAPDVQVQISQQAEKVGEGEMVGMKVGEIQGSVTVVHGNVIHINNPSPELVKQLGAVKAVSTEMKPSRGRPDSRREPSDVLEKDVRDVITQIRTADERGEHVEGVQVGSVRLSRVELLLKQAVLLKADADQMYLDQIEQNKNQIERSKRQSRGNRFELDLAEMLDGFDSEAHTAKLSEAYETLKEANSLEPTNAEVLLHMAQVMEGLEEAPREISRLLYQVQNLLTPPRNNTDKFHLAQATFLSASAGEYQHDEQLRTARALFAELSRADWVQQCDDLLAANDPSDFPTPPGAVFERHATPRQEEFQPVGNWQAQMSNGGTMMFQLFPGGQMQGVQQAGIISMNVNFNGQWAFDPYNHLLQLQGLVGGFTPFVLQIVVQGCEAGGYRGMGSDGQSYMLERC